jgi:ketosteroid isomerase-like protein
MCAANDESLLWADESVSTPPCKSASVDDTNGRTLVNLMTVGTLATLAATAAAQGDRALRESLLAQDRATSSAVRRDGVMRGLAAALDSETLVLLEGAPILRGRGAVRFLAGQTELRAARVEWLPLAALVADDGSLGVTYGVTTVGTRRSDGEPLRFGKYVSVWRRHDAVWALVAHVQTGLLQQPDTLVHDVGRAVPGARGGRADSPGSAAFAAADSAFAHLAADSGAPAAFAAFVAPTGVMFPATGEILVGPAAIRARMMESRARSTWVWAPLFAGASDDRSVGFTVGEAVITSTLGETSTTYFSKYLTVWRRMPDGAIRFLADAGNPRPR